MPVPNLQRLYFKFSPPIDTALFDTNNKDPAVFQDLYNDVRSIVNAVSQGLS